MNCLDQFFRKKEATPKRDPEKEYETELVKHIYERFHPKLRGELKEETVICYLQAIEISMINTNHLIAKMNAIIKHQQDVLNIELGNQATEVSEYWNKIYKE